MGYNDSICPLLLSVYTIQRWLCSEFLFSIFITKSQPNAYLHFPVAPQLLHHSILFHLYSVSILFLIILQLRIQPISPLCLSTGSLSCSSCSAVLRSPFFLVSIPSEKSWHWTWGRRDGQSCSGCQQAQMGLDTLYAETPKGLLHLLWTLDSTHAKAVHIQAIPICEHIES